MFSPEAPAQCQPELQRASRQWDGRAFSKPKFGDSKFLKMSVKVISVLALSCLIAVAIAKPTIYKRNEDNNYEPVMVPVSSTVIPLLVYKVEYGFGFVPKDKKGQSAYKPDGVVKLITAKKTQDKKA